MAKLPQISVEPRTVLGHQVNQLRRTGLIPGNIFGKTTKSVSVQLPATVFGKLYDEVGETSVLEMTVKGETKPRHVLISQLQRHPVTDLVLHVDFHQVALTEKVTANVPLEFTGESAAVKEQGGVLVTVVDEIEVEALPTELPDKFVVDLSALKNVGESLTLKDLKLDRAKVTIALEDEATIVTVQAPAEEEVAPAPAEEVAEAPAEGAAPAPETPAAEAQPETKE